MQRSTMLRLTILPALAAGAQARPAFADPPADKTWEMVWSDEFDGTDIDRTKWDNRLGPRRSGVWVKEDAYLDGMGNLILRTKMDDMGNYTSGALVTFGRFLYSFGYYEVSCKLPTQPGHWPAFWIQSPTYGAVIGDPASSGAEIDVMEYPWRDGHINQSVHWDGYAADHKETPHVYKIPGSLDDFHTFALAWSETGYVFYVDGTATFRSSKGISKRPEYLELTDEIGPWPNNPLKIQDATLPDYFTCDYIRVWREKGTNQAPVVTITATPMAGRSPLVADLDGSASRDYDGSITSYAWDFGDGATDVGPQARHTFTGDGTYTVTLTATDNEGATGSTTLDVMVGNFADGGTDGDADDGGADADAAGDDAGSDGGADAAGGKSSKGCSCRLGGEASPGAAGFASIAALALALVGRRTRRRR